MGAKTSWSYNIHADNPAYLCTDGSRLEPLQLESTTHQRRWRVVGTTNSCSMYDVAEMAFAAQQVRAAQCGKALWMPDWGSEKTAARLWRRHRVLAGLQAGGTTDIGRDAPNLDSALAFEFQSPKLPYLQAVIWITLRASRDQYTVTSLLTYHAPAGPEPHQHQPMVEQYTGWPDWPDLTPTDDMGFGRFPHLTFRQALSHYLSLARTASGIETVRVLDGRGGEPAEAELVFTRTNFTEEHYREAFDRLDADKIITRLAEHLDGVQAELRNLGMVVPDRAGLRAMETASLAEFPCWIKLQPDDDLGDRSHPPRDHAHMVTLDLLHGLVMVDCAVEAATEGALEAWEVARFKAGLSGEQDTLLEYARAWAEPGRRATLNRLIAQKAVQAPPRPRRT